MSNDVREPLTETVATDFPAEPPGEPRFAGPLERGRLLDGRYKIVQPLGRGGNATVYSAFDRHLGQTIALKVLHPHRLTESNRARFRREAQIARSLDHPNLLRVFDLGAEGPFLYLAMELVDGETLAQRIASRAPLALSEALALALPILDALAYLHARGAVHRDVKPSNVVVGTEGRVKLADFGLALLVELDEERLTESQAVLGTLRYLSPEQAKGEPATAASDLYAFGLVLFEMLTCRLPHEGATTLRGLLDRVSRSAPSLSSVRPDLPAWLDDVLRRLLAREPARRYSSAKALRFDLEHRRSPYRSPRFARRGLFALAAGLLVWSLLTITQPGELAQLVLSQQGLRGVDSRGRTVFQRPELDPYYATILRDDGRPTAVAVASSSDGNTYPWQHDRLLILEPRSGEIEKAIELESPAWRFPEFSDTYSAIPRAIDLDDDGRDELLVARNHRPYNPCAVMLIERELDRQRTLFFASGHHYPITAADLDNDGDRELLLVGVVNPLGWRTAIAAVEISPPPNHPGNISLPAASPDLRSSQEIDPLWYSLAEPGSCEDTTTDSCITVEPGERLLRAHLPSGDAVLDFDGLRPTKDGPPSAQRIARRDDAWRALREGLSRLNGAADAATAEALLHDSRHLAIAAGDIHLARAAGVAQAIALALLQKPNESRELLAAIGLPPSELRDAQFEIARALHLADRPEEALPWYELALEPGVLAKFGRSPFYFLRAMVLAIAERDEGPERAIQTLNRWSGVLDQGRLQQLVALLRWHYEGVITEVSWDLGPASQDEDRYLALELRYLRDEDRASLALAVDAEWKRSSYTEPALHSLRAQLQTELGSSDAASIMHRARSAADAHRRRSPVNRLLFDVVQARWERLHHHTATASDGASHSAPDG